MSLEGLDIQPAKTRVECLVDENLKIDFEMGPAVGKERNITAYFSNQSGNDMTGLNMSVAVPKTMKIMLQSATSSVLSGNKSDTVQQEMKITNPFEGTKPIIIMIKVNYTSNGKLAESTKKVTFPLN